MVHFITKLFLRNSLVRIVAVGFIFYFALYAYDESSDSLSKRFNKKTLSKDYSEVKDKTSKIFRVISYSKSLAKSKKILNPSGESTLSKQRFLMLQEQIAKIDSLDQKLLIEGKNSKEIAKCGDFATFSYDLIDYKNRVELFSKNNRSMIISQQESILFERLLIAMTRGGSKEVVIDEDHNFLPAIVRKYFLSNKGNSIAIILRLDDLSKESTKSADSFDKMEKLICN